MTKIKNDGSENPKKNKRFYTQGKKKWKKLKYMELFPNTQLCRDRRIAICLGFFQR